jgi:hypothetical protein
MVEGGATQDDIIGFLKTEDVGVCAAIKIVMTLLGKTLSEAKVAVTSHEAWSAVAQAHRPFHDELVRALSDTEDGPTTGDPEGPK